MDPSNQMSRSLINIVGGGISGLTLARCLKHQGIPATIYDRSTKPASNNYGITLHASTYKPLIAALNVSEASFKNSVAVDAAAPDLLNSNSTSIFANRGKLEAWLREGIDVKGGYKVQSVESGAQSDNSGSSSTVVNFEDQAPIPSTNTIAADGPHSAIRTSLYPNHELTILPYVAFNGKRKYNIETFKFLYPLDQGLNINYHEKDVRLNISINSVSPDEVYLSWIYSRPARDTNDALYKPSRTKESATSIPEEFYAEVAALAKAGLPPLFADIFEPERLKGERILHWLMRSTLMSLEDLHTAAEKGVVFIGDAVHAEPILGGEGANKGIEDAVGLAEWIGEGKEIKDWYRLGGRYEAWQGSVKEAERRIGEIHRGEKTQASL